jgi:glycolate oxidase FAD binding subunit
MTPDNEPALQRLVDQVHTAAAEGRALRVCGGGSKAFYGLPTKGDRLDAGSLVGISSHEPTELVITARGGTPLAHVEAELAEHGQCLPFEPPHFAYHPGTEATLGGMVAAGLAGPSRASVGSVRDYLLGATLLNGRGEVVSFGGQVMKNVAGYDVARLLAGSLGILGVIVDVSLKVLPVAPASATLRWPVEQAEALRLMNEWAGRPLPINASAWWDDMLVVRLRGAHAAVRAAIGTLGGEAVEPALATHFWNGLRNHSDEFFAKARAAVEAGGALWRLSLPSTAAPLHLSGEQLIEWGGAQRWLCTTTPAAVVRDAAAQAGGHAVLFHAVNKAAGVFAPLGDPLERLHADLKRAFDPAGVFNRGRMFESL